MILEYTIQEKRKVYLVKIGIFHFVSALFAEWYQNNAEKIKLWSLFPLLLVCKAFIY